MTTSDLAPLSHVLLLIFSIFIMKYELSLTWRGLPSTFSLSVFIFKVFGAFLLLEALFLGLASVNLTDVASGVFASFAILGFSRKNSLLLALAGGASVLLRAAYLYPILVLVVFFLVESLYKKRDGGWTCIAIFFICIAPQYWLTYQHTGLFSFLDPSSVKYWQNFHFESNWAGYDTLIPAAGHPWGAGVPVGLKTAYQQHQWADAASLLGARMHFYFSSFVPWGKVYLSSPSERIFSPVVCLLHCIALIFSILYLRARAWMIGLPLLLILSQSLLIIPEQRFIFVIQLFLMMFTYLYFFGKVKEDTLIKSGEKNE